MTVSGWRANSITYARNLASMASVFLGRREMMNGELESVFKLSSATEGWGAESGEWVIKRCGSFVSVVPRQQVPSFALSSRYSMRCVGKSLSTFNSKLVSLCCEERCINRTKHQQNKASAERSINRTKHCPSRWVSKLLANKSCLGGGEGCSPTRPCPCARAINDEPLSSGKYPLWNVKTGKAKPGQTIN